MVLEVPSTLNRYAYTINDPINYNDPDGQFLGFIGSFFNTLGKILGFVQSLPPIPINGFQSTRNIGVDPNWQKNAVALAAAWDLAIAAARAEDDSGRQPDHLRVKSDCYERGSPGSIAGALRIRTYELVDREGRLVAGAATITEQNHVTQGTLGAGNSTWRSQVFDDNIQNPNVMQEIQTFTAQITSGINAGPSVPVSIQETNGAMHGSLGIYADRNWVVINGDWGTDNGRQDGNKRYCN